MSDIEARAGEVPGLPACGRLPHAHDRALHHHGHLPGAYFCLVINVVNGVYAIDISYIRAALSLGAKRRDIFRKIILPGTMPSIATGLAVGMGIAWMEIVAAEMIAGRAGLGFFTWKSHVGGNTVAAVAGMISIGVAGAFCSAIVWRLGAKLTPWRRLF